MYDKLTKKVIPYDKACQVSKKVKLSGMKVGFTTGVFDLLHMGHALHLKSIKNACDILIVGIDDNNTVRYIKGEGRPYYDETERAELLSAFEFIDYVFIFKGPCSSKILSEIKPDIYGVSPHDPSMEYKRKDSKIAKVKIFYSKPYLKSYSSSKTGRMIRFEYLLSTSPKETTQSEGDWSILQNSINS